jgi:aspartyl-tRNA(Asn)/glutamyl-tRNA(Gln) amidotransferase subunit A
VSRHGCFPLSPSLDIAGPLSRSVEDIAVIVQAIAGWDPRDPTTSRREVPDYPALLGGALLGDALLGGPVRGSGSGSRGGDGEPGGMTVGVIRELTSGADVDPEVREAIVRASAQLEKLGARVEEVSLPLLPLAGAVFMALADSEGAGLHLGWLRSRSGDYDQGTRRRLVTAALLPAAVVHQAERARELIRRQVHAALARHDVLLCPTSPRPAATIAQGKAPITSKAEVAGRFFTRRSYTTPASLAGVPALALPCGFSTAGLPLSLQLIGRRFDEATVLRVGHAYEQATDWHRRRPPL